MHNLKILVVALFAVCISTSIYAQSGLSVHLGPSFPISEFGADFDAEDGAGAGIGVNVGIKYLYNFSGSGLGIYGGVDFHYNGLQKKVKDDLRDDYTILGLDPDIKFQKYINVPITAGLQYTYQANEKFGVFLNAGAALNFIKITDMEVDYDGQAITSEADVANNIGVKIGVGILLHKGFSVSADYFGLGVHDFTGRARFGNVTEEIEGEGKVDLLSLTIGYTF